MTAQSVILPQPSLHACFIVLNLNQLTPVELITQLNLFLDRKLLLQKQNIDANIKTSIGFGLDLFSLLSTDIPDDFTILEPIQGIKEMPSVPADLIIHIASERSDLCYDLNQTFFDGIEDKVQVIDNVTAFRYLDKRDLTGFIDGTENPFYKKERAETALLPEGMFEDGSFIFAQRYLHDLKKFNQLDTNSQENVFGRSKLDSIEMSDDKKPHNAHIARTLITDDKGEELHIVRHSLPYGTGNGEKGSFFIAYSKDIERINIMLSRMYGTNNDGISDHLLDFTTPQNGAFYFCPSEELLTQLLTIED